MLDVFLAYLKGISSRPNYLDAFNVPSDFFFASKLSSKEDRSIRFFLGKFSAGLLSVFLLINLEECGIIGIMFVSFFVSTLEFIGVTFPLFLLTC